MSQLNDTEIAVARDLMKHATAEASAAIKRVAITSGKMAIANEVVATTGRVLCLQHFVLMVATARIQPGKEYEYAGLLMQHAIAEGLTLREQLRSGDISPEVLIEAAATAAKMRG